MSTKIKDELEEGLQTPDNKYTRKDVEQLTVTQLRAKLKSMKLPVYGCKRTLCQRILKTSSDAASQVSRNTFPLFDMSQKTHQETSTHSSIAELKLVELRERCKKAGLPSSGRKQELIDRLEVYYEKALLSDIDTKLEPSNDSNVPFLEWNESHVSRENMFFDDSEGNNIFGPPLSSVQIDPYSIQNETELEKHTKHDLKSVCKRLNLKLSGRKDEIIQRIWLHVSESKSSLMLEPTESRRKRTRHCVDDDLFEPYFSNSLKSRLRSNSASKPLPEIQNSFSSESINNRLHFPLSRRYYVFSTKFGDNAFQCTVCSAAEDFTATVRVGSNMSCSCAEFTEDIMCQHILFVFLRILKISSDNALLTKTTLFPAELDFVLKGLKQAIKSVKTVKSGVKKRTFTRASSESDNSVEVIRENWAGKQCGICFEPLGSNDSMIWCRMNCGKNMHMLCYEKWVEEQETDDNKCPYCLMPWLFIPKNTRFQSKQTINRVDWKDG